MNHERIARKAIITKLVRCSACALQFRIPVEDPARQRRFYQKHYASGMTTEMPSEDQLKLMCANRFKGSPKDFTSKIALLGALGIAPGARVLDYGSSWGYGVWQFREAGFNASGYEISSDRAAYARDRMGVDVTDNIDEIPKNLDIIFSSHVVEHLPDPGIILSLAQMRLSRGGTLVILVPNGSSSHLSRSPKTFHNAWGRLHGLYLDDAWFLRQYPRLPHYLASAPYGLPQNHAQLAHWDQSTTQIHDLGESELLAAIRF